MNRAVPAERLPQLARVLAVQLASGIVSTGCNSDSLAEPRATTNDATPPPFVPTDDDRDEIAARLAAPGTGLSREAFCEALIAARCDAIFRCCTTTNRRYATTTECLNQVDCAAPLHPFAELVTTASFAAK